MAKCKSCDGDGYIDCPKCGGKGTISVGSDFVQAFTLGVLDQGEHDIECSLCKGSVSVLHLVCSHYGIKVDRAVVADWGIYTVGAQPVGLKSVVKNETVA
ncbi:MAG: hypothetical protein ACLQU4_10700 [Limisphaerales bacterium]